MLIFFITGCTHSNDIDTLVIGIDDEFAPLSFRNEQNELVGFDIELAEETVRRMGVAAEFKPIDWSNKQNEITSGNVDLIWCGLDITEERKDYMIFSKPYMDDRQILLVMNDSELNIHSEYDLEGKIVATQSGSTSEDYIKQNEALRNSFEDYKVYNKFNEAIAALRNGEIEVLVCDELVARYEMNRYPEQFKIINVKIGFITETGIGFRKDDIELRDRVQEVFDSMIRDGTARKISFKWFQADLIKSKR